MDDFDAVYKTYFDDVFRFLLGISANESLAEELAQETFFRALKSIDKFRGESELRVWLCSIAKNLYYTHCQKQKRFTSEDSVADITSDETHFTELIADKELALQIHSVLHEIKEPYKEVFTLRIFGELSFSDIGAVFGKNAHWACVTFHRAKAMIQQKMREEYK